MKPLCLVLLALPFLAFSQTEKGAKPITINQSTAGAGLRPVTVTRAVVIGISNYQDDAIPDLRFADRDAEAFANWLRSPAGGSLDADHLKLLTDSAATTAQFDAALGWLIDESQPGDQAIIYFSGHGDVETKTRSQQGFLLCWDSPPQAYVSGAYPIFFLKEVVSTLSLENKTRVIVITDACRSGKLAGNSIGGSQLTSQNLSQQFASEIKILSCQPNEYSIEGEQWGGGRGAFSFHLLDGLYGMADGNSDASVSLFEIGRYLEDRVTTEVAPISQVPMVLGNRTEKLAAVDTKLLASLRSGKTNQMAILSAIESRGLEDEVLAGVDTSIRRRYHLFKKALKDKLYFEPAGACADAYFETLMAEPNLGRLHPSMRRNYAAALQDDAQQMMNTMLKTGLTNEVLGGKKPSEIYRDYPALLDRAANLLGSGHYMYPTLMARKSFFEGKISLKRAEGKKHYLKALEWQPDLPHAFVELISTSRATEADSANFYAAMAMEIAPGWALPYLRLASFNEHRLKMPDAAEPLLKQAFLTDSGSIHVWYEMARFYWRARQLEVSEQWFKKVFASSGEGICFPCAHNEAAYVYMDTDKWAEAEAHLHKAIRLDSTVAYFHNTLGVLYKKTQRYAEAVSVVERAIRCDSTFLNAYINLIDAYARIGKHSGVDAISKKILQLDSTSEMVYSVIGFSYARLKRFTEAERFARKSVELHPSSAECHVDLACILTMANQPGKAFESLDQSLKIGFNEYDWLQTDPDFAPLRSMPEWKAMMKKHFPDKVKD